MAVTASVVDSVVDRVVVVTGASGGIGSAIVKRFIGDGATVVGLDLLDGFDVTSLDNCAHAIQRIVDRHGRIDVLCNNAGVASVGDVVDSTEADWQRVFAVNVFGVANMCRMVIPIMRDQGAGAVVNICSVAAAVGLVERTVYSASKGAVLSMTRAMAADEARRNIRINCVSPGTVASPWVERLVAQTADPVASMDALRRRQPLGRLVSCEEVADAVAYLAAPTTFTSGADFLLDGGITGIRLVD